LDLIYCVGIGLDGDIPRVEFAGEKDTGEGPVALDGARGDFEDSGDLFDGKSTEVAQLDDAGLARIVGGEASEGLIDTGDFIEPAGGDGEVVVHLDAVEAAGAAFRIVAARVVHQDLAHGVSGEADEVGAVIPVDVFAGQAEIGLVDERGGLERVVGALAAHVGPGEAVELRVDEREQAVGGGGVAIVHGFEKLGDFAGRIGFHGSKSCPFMVL
jgi:hypothetical protein